MIDVFDLQGLSSYSETLEQQRDLFQRMVRAKKDGEAYDREYVFLVQHSPVITLGRHAKESNLLYSEEALRERGVECHRIERGGDVTFHGPGQLVVYPLIDLEKHHLGVKAYVDLLEEAVILTLRHYGITGERVEGASGVWIGAGTPSERKICAVGVKCSRFITMHGLALNVNTDLTYFSLINPCGFTDRGVTSMEKELGAPVDFSELKKLFSTHLLELLK